MKHIFLTGEIQIGKSTVIKKTLTLLKLEYGGFCTYFGSDRPSPCRTCT
jgi:nucleoside-triphosphatase